jgi:S1-C subfamily serine protease
MQRGDLLVSVGVAAVRQPVDFLDAVRDLPLGELVRVRYWRDGAEHDVDLAPVPPLEPAPPENAGSGKIA